MINWREERWDKENEYRQKYQWTINNLRYWSSNLKAAVDDKTILLAAFEDGRLVSLPEKIWINELRKIGAIKEFINFYYVRNTLIIGIQVATPEGKQFLVENLRYIENAFIISLEWYYLNAEVNMRIHWVPNNFYEEKLKEEMEKHVEFEEFKRELKYVDEEVSYPSSIISARGILRGESLEKIPHLLNFKGLEILIVVRGRKPLCLRCDQIGHKAYECPYRHCKYCKIMHRKEIVCDIKQKKILTYAEKTKQKKENEIMAYKGSAPQLSDWLWTSKEGEGEEKDNQIANKLNGTMVEIANKDAKIDIRKATKEGTEGEIEKTNTDKEVEEILMATETEHEEEMEIERGKQKRRREGKQNSASEKMVKTEQIITRRTYQRAGSMIAITKSENIYDNLIKEKDTFSD